SFASMFVVYAGILGVYTIFMAPFGLAGWKLFYNRSGARFWGVIASLFSVLFFFPLGLFISILGFIFLFSSTGTENKLPAGAGERNFHPPSPPQQNWQ